MEFSESVLSTTLKRQAQILYWAGYRVSEIARQLALPHSTISSWKEREKWQDTAPIGRVEITIEARLVLLINKEHKSGSDFKEIDLLQRQMERVARIKRYSAGFGDETDLSSQGNQRQSGKIKSRDKNPISDEQQTALLEGFLPKMFAYQKHWYQAGKKHRIRNVLKSRQIGATYYFALEAFIDAIESGRNQLFISASKKQALQFRAYICEYAKNTADIQLKGENIELPNGAQLIFLGTNSKTAQSYHGNLYFDEIFWVPKFAEMRKVAAGMASQKRYRQTYFSTPSTISHPAYAFWSGKIFNRGRAKSDRHEFNISHDFLQQGKVCADSHWRQIVTLYDAEKGGCDLFDADQLKLENSLEEFEQLYLCQFIDDNASVFKFSELQKCQVDSLEQWADFKPFYKRPFANREVWLGYDPAYTGDRAALAIIAPPRLEGGSFRVLEIKTFHGLDYEAQASQIKDYLNIYHVTRLTIDKTGMGDGVFQIVKKFYPKAVGINYDIELKNEMVLKTINFIQKRRLEYDLGANEITTSFMTIKKQITRSGRQLTYLSDRSIEAGHGDIAWAIMSCLINQPYDGLIQSSSFVMGI